MLCQGFHTFLGLIRVNKILSIPKTAQYFQCTVWRQVYIMLLGLLVSTTSPLRMLLTQSCDRFRLFQYSCHIPSISGRTRYVVTLTIIKHLIEQSITLNLHFWKMCFSEKTFSLRFNFPNAPLWAPVV